MNLLLKSTLTFWKMFYDGTSESVETTRLSINMKSSTPALYHPLKKIDPAYKIAYEVKNNTKNNQQKQKN